MNRYTLGYSPEAKEGIDFLPTENPKRIAKRTFEALAENPYKGKKLVGKLTGLYSIRITRRYRAIYQVDTAKQMIFVLDLSHRKESYR